MHTSSVSHISSRPATWPLELFPDAFSRVLLTGEDSQIKSLGECHECYWEIWHELFDFS